MTSFKTFPTDVVLNSALWGFLGRLEHFSEYSRSKPYLTEVLLTMTFVINDFDEL